MKKWILAFLIAFSLLALFLITSTDRPRADISGYSQVVMLELKYLPGNELITARVHLASGTALIHEAKSGKESVMLLEIAQIMSSGGTRLFVDLEKDAIKSFQVSVP